MKHWVAIAIFIICFSLTTYIAPHAGVSWDEPDNIFAAGVYINFFQKGMDAKILASHDASASYFQDKIFTQEPSLFRYPPFPLYIGSMMVLIGEKLFGTLGPQQIIAAFHMASGFFWAIFAVALYYFIRLFGFSIFVAGITALLGALHPTLFGYGFSTIKDSSQVSLFVVSLLLLVLATTTKKKRWFVLGTITWGAAMATKINAIYVPCIWAGWRMLLITSQTLIAKQELSIHSKLKQLFYRYTKILAQTAMVIAGGLIVMVVLWPYLWFDPVTRLGEVFTYFTTVGTGYKVFWNGEHYMVGTGAPLPWYPIIHMIVGTPLFIQICILVGGFLLIKEMVTQRKVSPWFVLLLVWAGVPLFRILSPYAAFYDGMRHFLEVLPPVLLLSAWGIRALESFLHRRLGDSRQSLALTTLVCLPYLCFLAWHFFPYNSGYVNALVRNPNTTLERDYGGVSVAEAVRLAHTFKSGPSRFFVPIAGHLSWYYLSYGDSYVYGVDDADILILINKPSHIIKTTFDTEVSSMFELKGSVIRGNDDFAWIYVKRS